MQPDWVFLDVGNVLMDERAWLPRYHELVCSTLSGMVPGLTWARYQAVRADVEARPGGGVREILEVLLPDPDARREARATFWPGAVEAYYELGVPADGVHEVLEELGASSRLGVIANQHPPVHEWMRAHRLAGYFDIAVYDCDLGVAKPDPRIFQHALGLADCPAGRAVMVGDRFDNDILPARAVGMRTVWLRAFGQWARSAPACSDDAPDVEVPDLRLVPAAIRSL